MKKNHISNNIKFLRESKGLSQSAFAELFKVSRDNIASYERGSEPKITFLSDLVNYFHINFEALINIDLSLTNSETKCEQNSIKQNDTINDTSFDTYPNVQKIVSIDDSSFEKEYVQNISDKNSKIKGDKNYNTPNVRDLFPFDDDNFTEVPIADISVAAGGGAVNSDYYEVNGSIRLPKSMLRSKGTRMCVKVDGRSMEPTIPHASKVIIRLLDRCEWHNIKDNQVYVVTDREGGTYIKRCTNKLHSEGVVVLMSDNTAFSPITLTEDELNNIWVVELFMMFDLPNKRAEDDLWRSSMEGEVSEIKQQLAKVLRMIDKDNLKRS